MRGPGSWRARTLSVLSVVALVVFGLLVGGQQAQGADIGQPVCAAAGSTPQQVISNAITERSGAGWAGADVSASVRLKDGRILWWFGDTWIGAVAPDGTRDAATTFVSSTIGVQQGNCVTFVARRGPAGWTSWWSRDGNPTVNWWPMGAFESQGRLFVTFLGYSDALVNGFLAPYVGAYLTVWDPTTLQLLQVLSTPSDRRVQWGLGFAEERGQLYIYGVTPDAWPRHWYLAKWSPPNRWQFQTSSGSWSSLASRAAPIAGGYDFQSYPYVVPWQGGVAVVEGRGLWHGLTADFWWAPSPVGPYRRMGSRIATVPDDEMPLAYEYLGTVVPVSPSTLLLATNANTPDLTFFGRDGLASYMHVQTITAPPVLHAPDVELRRGSRGEAVVQLQSILKVKGYGPTMAVDGRYGSVTAAAVKRLQLDLQRRGLAVPADGVYRRATAWALASQMLAGRL